MPRVRLPIETERLLIRPLVIDDAGELHQLFSDPEAMQFLTPALPTTVTESADWVQAKIDLFDRDGGLSLWAIVARDTGAVVGDVGLQWEEYWGERMLDLGCRLIRRYWGLGYATEASRAVLAAGFRDLGIPRIVASTHVDNARARRVLALLGGTYERDVDAHGMRMVLYGFTS